jgi:hypothetical protein
MDVLAAIGERNEISFEAVQKLLVVFRKDMLNTHSPRFEDEGRSDA